MAKRTKILITIHTLLYNRGSEAVLRSMVYICRYWKPDSHITVATGEEGEVLKDIPDVDRMTPRYDSGGGVSHLISAAEDADIILVTGADNYDGPNGNRLMEEINTKLFQKKKVKTILYGCSLSGKHFIKDTQNDFLRFSYITARESITHQLLLEKLPSEKIRWYPDSAFVLPMEKCPLPMGFELGKMIGINISNLILTGRYGADESQILRSYQNLIDFILKKTDYKIILVQHIVNNGFDLDALRKLFCLYEKEKRILLMKTELLNAMQIKYFISKLNFLVTARTHAAIAAYSTCVPVLAVSYSVKSVGIAKDLFEDSEPFVLPLNHIKNGMELQERFQYMLEHEDEIRSHLQRIIPAYKMRALQFGEIL